MQTQTLNSTWHFVLTGSVSVVSGVGFTPYYSLAA